MRNFKKILLALSVAVSMAAFSSVSLAEKARIPADVAIAAVVTKVNEASAMIAAGGSTKEDIANTIKMAKDLAKEVSANDKVDRVRQKMVGDLKKAIADAKDSKMAEANADLKEAISKLDQMKSLI
jgi:hypothetical protein